MKYVLARIQARRRSASPAEALLRSYIERIAVSASCEVRDFADEAALREYLDRATRRTRPALVITDSRGKQVTSEEFAKALGGLADRGVQEVVLAVGPPDGWSAGMREQASLTIAFGRITLPHELAAVVLAEQTYRALAILAGHPYHSGH